MEPKQIAKEMIDFNKTAFDNSFKAMTVLQDQTEKIVSAFMEQTTFFPEDGKKLVTDWINTYKKGRDEFKNSADESFKKVESFFKDK